MLLATDVHYFDQGGARAAGVVLDGWSAEASHHELTAHVDHVQPYVTGQFYRRELPCLLRLLGCVELSIDCVVVDGHVWLGTKAGLGAHLHEATGLPVVGVAKNPHAAGGARPVRRGGSTVPLYVSSVGLPVEDACRSVTQMHGPHRLPTALKRADRIARDGL
ncbi:MAG: endonuclease V [Deltaproteobacteria bacterium]|nr:endonuclease V [Deltaproteobacteria bacterium]